MSDTSKPRHDLTEDDAIGVLSVSLDALVHRRSCERQPDTTEVPVGLIRQALAQFEALGNDLGKLRERFRQEGVDLSPIAGSPEAEAHPEQGSQVGSQTFRSRVPRAIREAVLEKFRQGWTKSRIAREFRLNRRTVIRICRGD